MGLRRVSLLFVAAVLAAPAASRAAITWSRDCGGSNFECAHLTVPLDRGGTVPGTIRLYVEHSPPEHPSGAIFAIAGGPGQGATPLTENFNNEVFGGARDIVVMDQRGTGQSGALDCPTLDGGQLDGPIDARTAACAQRLGARRAFYTTRDSVEDYEALRQALGVDKVTLYGVSYGTKVAIAYAMAHPEHVESLILDSVVDPTASDPFDLDGLAALPRTLAEVCRGQCAGITDDYPGDVARLVSRMPVRGAFVDGRGRRSARTVTARNLYSDIRAADLDPAMRAALPAAVHAALNGDPAPLVRIEHRFDDVGTLPPDPTAVQSLSFTDQAAALCEEAPFPWARDVTDPVQRDAAARAAADATPDSAFAPFTRAAMLVRDANNLLFQCRRWPTSTPAPTLVDHGLPDVPVLVLEGLEDTRTPLEVGERVAARFPRAQVVRVPKTAHAVVGRHRCARTAVARFLAGRPAGDPCANVTGKPILPLAPRTVVAAGGPRAALLDTLDDLAREAGVRFSAPMRGGGLRGGWFAIHATTVAVHGFAFLRGLAISGSVDSIHYAGRLTVSGVAGTVTISRKGRITGTLAGHRVSLAWKPPKPVF